MADAGSSSRVRVQDNRNIATMVAIVTIAVHKARVSAGRSHSVTAAALAGPAVVEVLADPAVAVVDSAGPVVVAVVVATTAVVAVVADITKILSQARLVPPQQKACINQRRKSSEPGFCVFVGKVRTFAFSARTEEVLRKAISYICTGKIISLF